MPVHIRRIAVGAALAFAAVLLGAAGGLALTASRVDGSSMTPTLANGELVVANPFDHRPGRSDLVLIQQSAGTRAVKRVIGLPGDRVSIGGGTIRVLPVGEGAPLVLPAPPGRVPIHCCEPDGRASVRPAPATVPPGSYFVLGDNPDASQDSRMLGWVAAADVAAVVVGRLWPPGPLSRSPGA